ncbi:hypothetical protein ACIBCD_18510 [Nocardia brasiliensis]|uniref:hypothetical protein n=1 Tax=Nocardia brasiliensis TaxID=37326 RepID=UPI0037967A95
MADSVEHQFLSQRVVDVLSDLAKSRLYSYTEAERRKFDFACELQRDWSRPSSVLVSISTAPEPFRRPGDMGAQLDVSTGAIRERLLRLLGCGFLTQFGGGATRTRATLKGRVFLDLVRPTLAAASDRHPGC